MKNSFISKTDLAMAYFPHHEANVAREAVADNRETHEACLHTTSVLDTACDISSVYNLIKCDKIKSLTHSELGSFRHKMSHFCHTFVTLF